MKISEVFTSIQGESSYAGLPCHFVRLSGCNLRCSYCDNQYAYEDFFETSVEEILLSIKSKSSNIRLVEITGGEPLLQKETLELITRLIDKGYKTLIETNGSISIKDVHKEAIIIMDIKTPSSAMSEHNLLDNINFLKPKDEVKFVITNRFDYEWSNDFVKKNLKDSKASILYSPSFNVLNSQTLAQWIIEDGINVRLNLQLHKIIFGEDKRGV
ncbi:MAG: radical SAM protein [Thermodesulfovibrionales bacterium]|nr:radical SAM protein [Thermodesulfovibrionales bacterium]